MIQRHSEPDIEVTGHYWEIVEFYKIGEQALLVWIKFIFRINANLRL